MNDGEITGYAPMLRRFLTFLTQDPAAAEELAQETFRIAVEKSGQLRPDSDCGAWLRAIAKNAARNHLRKKRARWIIFDTGMVEMAEQRFVEVDADKEAFWESRRRALGDCVGKLREEDRLLILRRYERREPVQDMARRAGVEPNTLSKRLERLRDALRKCVEARLEGSEP